MSSQTINPVRLTRDQHGIPKDSVDANAVDITEQLHNAGFAALLVGGCVRDLLLGHKPKDFDVATSATPEEVRSLFRRSRLVGRRFRIAHVRYGRDVIEVSTFRSSVAAAADERSHSADGMILRDNVYGTVEEDAFRRDFTINALYYDPQTDEVIDYVGGLEDISRQRLHFIGDTSVRLREDPVRALRALRFQAKIGFTLDPAISAALPEAAEAMSAIPPARLFDEVVKLFLSGYAARAWELLVASPIKACLFPACAPDDLLVTRAMQSTDSRIAVGKPVTPGFILAALLWQDYLARVVELEVNLKPAEARYQAAADSFAEQQSTIAVPRRFSQFAREVWSMQERLETRRPKTIKRIMEHQRFRAGYDLLMLRADVGEPLAELAQWWTRVQEVGPDEQADMISALPAGAPRKRKRRRKRRGGGGRSDTPPSDDPAAGADHDVSVECP